MQSREMLRQAGFPELGEPDRKTLTAGAMDVVAALQDLRTRGSWSHESVLHEVEMWVDRLKRDLDPRRFAEVEEWIHDHIVNRTRGSWDLAFPGLMAVLQAEPKAVILPAAVAEAVHEAVTRNIQLGTGDWYDALAIADGLTQKERDFAGLILGNEYGLDPSEMVADSLANAVSEQQVRRAWANLRKKLTDSEIDAVVAAARSVAHRMPNSRIPPELIERPGWV